MAIVQISQITNRKGINSNLPQLAGAEFGWSTDTRQLYIGNGTLQDGAPVVGNTEILTEFSIIPPPTPTSLTLAANVATATTIFTLVATAVVFTYTIIRDTAYRAGTITLVADGAGSGTGSDANVQNADTGILLGAITVGSSLEIQYTSTAGSTAQLSYVITIAT